MTRSLRKYHYYVWRVLGVVLVLSFALAILWLPKTQRPFNHPEETHSNP
ncbi:MAG: hypothetical protein HOP37_07535 [Cyclobacteriaceae bacterium]|nr:hypothetical protein [Cyclobacteriaceae bacterium]